MNISSPYFRSLLISGVFFVAVAWKMVSRHPGHWSTYPPTHFVGMGFAALLAGLLVGLIASRFEQWRSWWIIGVGTILGWFALMGLMLLVIRVAYPKPNEPKFSNADEMMKYFASEAAQWVKQDKGIDLNYSFESINLIEEQLAQLSKTVDKANPQPGMRGQAMGYGAYVGEVLRLKEGGSWSADHPKAGERSYPLTLKGNTVVFPVMWSWKRILNGEEDNVYHKAFALTAPESNLTNALEVK